MRTLFSCHSFKSHNGWRIAGNYFGLFSSHLTFWTKFSEICKRCKSYNLVFSFQTFFWALALLSQLQGKKYCSPTPGLEGGKRKLTTSLKVRLNSITSELCPPELYQPCQVLNLWWYLTEAFWSPVAVVVLVFFDSLNYCENSSAPCLYSEWNLLRCEETWVFSLSKLRKRKSCMWLITHVMKFCMWLITHVKVLSPFLVNTSPNWSCIHYDLSWLKSNLIWSNICNFVLLSLE